MLSFFLRKPKASRERSHRPRRSVSRVMTAFGPPITSEESQANLTDLVTKLNGDMKCHAGRRQVFIRSLLTPAGTTQPRITLRCHLRKDVGLPQEVFYEYIRDVCCCDPEQCEAYRDFKERFVET